ncbi:MAG: hypothetical protein ACOVKR_08270, partial [Limnohabitans sp.]
TEVNRTVILTVTSFVGFIKDRSRCTCVVFLGLVGFASRSLLAFYRGFFNGNTPKRRQPA